MRADHLSPHADLTVEEQRVRADQRLARHSRRPAQQGPGLQGGVLADLDGDVHPGRRRIDHGDAREHPRLHDPTVQLAAHRGQLSAVVDPLGLPHVVGDKRRDPAARGARQGQHVGQVELPLVVVRAQLGQGVHEHLAVEGVDAGVDLVDGQLIRGGVAVLHDPGDRAVLGANDPPVPRGVGDPGRQDGRRVAVRLVLGHQLGQGRAGEQGDIAIGDHDRAAADVTGRLQRALHGVPGAQLLVLHGRAHMRGDRRQVRGHGVTPVPDDHHEPVGAQDVCGGHRMPHEAASADLVEHLGGGRAHPLALPGGKDDDSADVGCGVGHEGPSRGRGPARIARPGMLPVRDSNPH